ncbi:MAG: ShlB/FhaC/HecB family hemolysin secretion/activation protein [Casimicrobiaceae bacterium]
MPIDLPPDAPAPVPAPAAAIVAPAQEAPTIFADSHGFHYAVTGNKFLAPEVVQAALESGASPKEAIEALNSEYFKRGYFLTALGGEVNRQLVSIKVLHGRITEADMVPGLAPYFSGIEDRDDLNRNTMIRKTLLAEFYAGREGMRPVVGFGKAEAVGGSKITVTQEPIEGAKSWAAGVSFGNLGSRFSSRYVANAQGAVRPGGGLELSLGYTLGLPGLTDASGGSQYQSGTAGASLVTPWGIYGVSYNGIKYTIGESAAPLYPEGDIDITSATGVQLFYADETTRLSVNEAFTHTDNVVNVFNRAFNLTSQHYDFITLGVTGNKQFSLFGQNANIGVALTGMQGLSPPRGTFLPIDLGSPDTRFAILQVNVNYQQALPAGYTFGASFNAQWADSTVPQNQQWILGGLGNLSAWLPAVVIGDMGTLGRVAVNSPSWSWEGVSVSGSAFVEAGLTRFHFTAPTIPVTRTLADAGISITGSVSGGTSLTLAYALPVYYRNIDRDLADAQRAQVFFSLTQSF